MKSVEIGEEEEAASSEVTVCFVFVKRLKYREDIVQTWSSFKHGDGAARHSLATGRLSKYGQTKIWKMASISEAEKG